MAGLLDTLHAGEPRGYGATMPAPDFTLIDQAGEPWTLSAQRGTAHMLLFLRGDW